MRTAAVWLAVLVAMLAIGQALGPDAETGMIELRRACAIID
jgi:hypothetical protein